MELKVDPLTPIHTLPCRPALAEQHVAFASQVRHIQTDPYRDGTYFADPARHAADAAFKVEAFVNLLKSVARRVQLQIKSMADVGCGSGDVAVELKRLLPSAGYSPEIEAWDISPHINQVQREGIKFIHGDFCAADHIVDLVTLFDVVEHIPGPTDFLRQIASRCRWIGLHIPLDNCWNSAMRNLYRDNLRDPGHLICLDAPAALTLLSMAGLTTIDFEYTLGFRAPCSKMTRLQRMAYPVRALIAGFSPWLLSKTLCGVSLIVLAKGRL
jgi:SAM-dependent methyltransferase